MNDALCTQRLFVEIRCWQFVAENLVNCKFFNVASLKLRNFFVAYGDGASLGMRESGNITGVYRIYTL